MTVSITGHHVQLTDGLKEAVTAVAENLQEHFPRIIKSSFVLALSNEQYKAEGNVHVKGKSIHAEATSSDMYGSIQALSHKLYQQVDKIKKKSLAHRHDIVPVEGPMPGRILKVKKPQNLQKFKNLK